MTEKQITIDYKNLCENYSKEVGCYNTFDGSCIQEQCFTYKLLQQLQAKEQECETLASQLDFEVQKKECLEQECEELKSQIETYSKMLDSTEFRVALTDVRTGEREVWRKLGSKADRYRKALEEIEEVCLQDRAIKDVCLVSTCFKRDRVVYDIQEEILDIIDKAKGKSNG